jgi:8-oxo-dGTP pyrophosphatase MutT (NUDIX family)
LATVEPAEASAVAHVIPQVRAAGGVIGRVGPDVEVIVIHRPKYDDWSLPKGKAEPGETDEECAVREVEEETGLRCQLGVELPTIRYRDRKHRFKEVRYWDMEPLSGELQEGSDEVDQVRWLPLADALDLLSYVHDREVVAAWAAAHS